LADLNPLLYHLNQLFLRLQRITVTLHVCLFSHPSLPQLSNCCITSPTYSFSKQCVAPSVSVNFCISLVLMLLSERQMTYFLMYVRHNKKRSDAYTQINLSDANCL
jgi:hypothetical protein